VCKRERERWGEIHVQGKRGKIHELLSPLLEKRKIECRKGNIKKKKRKKEKRERRGKFECVCVCV
jgi:hypothetical protein